MIESGQYNFFGDKSGNDAKIKALQEKYKQQYQDALNKYNEAAQVTTSDIGYIKSMESGWRDGVKQTSDDYMDAFGIKYGEAATTNLSGLQQGVQQITEQQAGALEAKANSIDAQGYLRNTLLQIF